VTDETLHARTLDSLRSFCTLIASGTTDSRVLAFDGLSASIAPHARAGSAANSVVYENSESLVESLDRLAIAYEEAGVESWCVWVPEGDRHVTSRLAGAGYELTDTRTAMGLELERLGGEMDGRLESSPVATIGEVAMINDRAYGYAGSFAHTLARLPADAALLYVLRAGDDPAACLMALDEGEDCGLYLVATVPEAQGRGLATALTMRALVDGRKRGCTTSTLQANPTSESFYLRLGYRQLGVLELWHKHR
jgi:GNAT superfamily N-acetyltransferase